MSAQLQDLHNKYCLISEVNKRLYVKSKRLEEANEKLCHETKAAKEEVKEQRSLILDLQLRLGRLEAAKKQEDKLLDSEKGKEKELCLQTKVAKDEMKEQKSLMLHLQQRLDGLEATMQRKDAVLAVSPPQEAEKKSSTKAGTEERQTGKQSKMANDASGKPAAKADAKEQRKPERKEPPAAALQPKNKTTNCKDKAAACGRTGATAKPVSRDSSPRKPRYATAPKGQSGKPGAEMKAANRNKPGITLDSRPNLKEAKPAKAAPQLEKKDSKLPPITKERAASFHRTRLKENPLPGRPCSNRSGTSVPNAVRSPRETSLTTAVQTLHDAANNRTPKLPLLRTEESREDRSLLFPVNNIKFVRDKDFSPWEHESLASSDSF